jgi:hypothetical protein
MRITQIEQIAHWVMVNDTCSGDALRGSISE